MSNAVDDGLYGHLLELMHAVPAGYRFGAYWTMSEDWKRELQRRFGDPGNALGMNTLLGYRIELVADPIHGFPKFQAPDSEKSPEVPVPPHTHKLDVREVAEALEECLRRANQGALGSTEKCKECGHPLTAHTSTDDSFPYAICARVVNVTVERNHPMYERCSCKLWCGIEP